MTDLTDHLLDAYPEPELDTGGYQLEDDTHADWALLKLGSYENEVARIRAAAKTEIDRVRAWETESVAAPQRRADWFRSIIVDFYRRAQHANPTIGKTYVLPAGTITRRKLPDRVEMPDPDALVLWALEHDHDLVKYTAQVAGLKAAGYAHSDDGVVVRAATGEVVPGVAWVTGEDRYDAKPLDRNGDPT